MKRVFAAIELPDAARDIVSSYSRSLAAEFSQPRVKWVPRDNLHITLHFAGSVDPSGLDALTEAVAAVVRESAPFTLSLNGTGAFVDRKHRSNTLWIAASELQAVTEGAAKVPLLTSISRAIRARIGCSPQKLRPHVTIARSTDHKSCGPLIARHLANNFKPVRFQVDELLIYESTLLQTGPLYNVLSRHSLTGV